MHLAPLILHRGLKLPETSKCGYLNKNRAYFSLRTHPCMASPLVPNGTSVSNIPSSSRLPISFNPRSAPEFVLRRGWLQERCLMSEDSFLHRASCSLLLYLSLTGSPIGHNNCYITGALYNDTPQNVDRQISCLCFKYRFYSNVITLLSGPCYRKSVCRP